VSLVPPLVPGVCQVWWARPADARPGLDSLLGPADLARRARLTRPADWQRTTVAWAVARLVVGAASGVRPADVVVDRTCPECGAQHGKPRVPEVHVSVTHSAGCVAVAIHPDGPVGIDVEALGGLAAGEREAVAGLVLAPEERAELAVQPDPDRALLTLWARKEAVVKATGTGVSVALERLVVPPPGAAAQVLRWDGALLSLAALHPPAGFVAALAVLGGPPAQVVERDAGPLLRGAAGD
jgi:4'-phosphopantetheinyl transferase